MICREEARLRDTFCAAVGALPGVMVYRSEVIRGQQKQRSLPLGHPDLIMCASGTVILLEWKSPTGRLEPDQVAFHRAWRAAGGTVLVCCDPAEACDTVAAFVQEPVSTAIRDAGKKLRTLQNSC